MEETAICASIADDEEALAAAAICASITDDEEVLAAAVICASIADDEEALAAAALHDVVEDAEVTADEIESLFGRRVAEIVAGDSEDKREGPIRATCPRRLASPALRWRNQCRRWARRPRRT